MPIIKDDKRVRFIYHSILPKEYQQVEYIQSDGNQYLNLGFTPSSNTNFELKLATTEANPTVIRRVFGGYTNYAARYELALGSGTISAFINYYDFTYYTGYVPTVNVPFIISKKVTSLISPAGTTTLPNNSFNGDRNAYLFASNRESTNKFVGRVYYLKVYTGSTLTKYLVPCFRKVDNVAGMYDIKTGTFYTNQGTGAFIVGNSDAGNIDQVYHGEDLVFEQGYIREQTGALPLTTEHQAIGRNLLQYQIYGNAVQRNIPDEYQEVQYVESDGNQYLDLGITTGSSTNFEIRLATTNPNPTSIKRIFGGYSNNQTRYELCLSNTSNGIFFNYLSSPYYTTYVPTLNEPFVITKKGSTLTSPSGDVTLATGSFTNPVNAYLFATNRTGTENFIGRIYYMKIYNGNNLIRNLFPCYRISDNVIGMYDTVSNTFFVNQGTGTFAKGSNVTQPTPTSPVAIQSVGDLVTDSSDPNYGKYKIPVIVSDGGFTTTVNIYVTKPLRKITDRGTDYADYIDFNEGKVYRVVGEYIFDSTHYTFNSVVSNNIRYFYRVISDVAFPIAAPFVTHYNGVRTFYSGMPNLQATVNGGAYRSLYVRNDSYTTNTDFNNHIKSFADGGNPMTMYYVLPVSLRKTENVTLPDLPTFKGTTIFTLGSGVNGSSMYVKYKGR